MKWVGGCAAFATAIAAIYALAADEKPPAPADRLVVKAHLAKAPSSVPGGVWAMCMTHATPPEFPDTKTCFDPRTGDLEVAVMPPKIDGPGTLQIVFGDTTEARHAIAFLTSFHGTLDLGEIALADDAPVLLAGHVTSPEKKPVWGTCVDLVVESSPGHFHTLHEFAGTTDADGAFVCRGDVRGGTGVVRAETRGRWQIDRERTFSLGAKDVSLVATSTASVSGTVALPAGVPYEGLVLVISGTPGATRGARPDCDSFSSGGTRDVLEFPASASFRVAGLMPGAYDLRLRYRGASRPLARVQDVTIDDTTNELPPLRVTTPPRRLLVHVVGADGAPAAGASLWIRNKGDRGKFRPVPLDERADAKIVLLGDEAEITAHAPGTDYVVGTTGAEATLQLVTVAATPITIALPDAAPRDKCLTVVLSWRAPANVASGAVDAASDDTDLRQAESVEVALPQAGAPQATVALPGWYEVMLRRRTENGWTGHRVGCVLVSGGKAIVVTLDVTAAQMTEFLSGGIMPPSDGR